MQNNYNTNKTGRTRWIVIFIATAVICGLIGWLIGSEANAAEGWKPDAVYPMANVHISWEQSYHAGAWGE